MEGAVAAERKAFNLALIAAWHTARFALNGFNDKGRLAGHQSLSDLLLTDRDPNGEQSLKYAKAIAFFHRMQAKGVPVKITRH